jgi:4,5-dihydroxyphthalate decarboxylase
MQLRALLGDYPNTAALKSGAVRSERLSFDFVDQPLPQNSFKDVIRGEFDVAELAIVTFLQAYAHGKPLRLLPTVVMTIDPHPCIAATAASGIHVPADLAGRRIGIRAHSVTTVTWVRGILANDFGLGLDGVDWVAFEDPHVPECVEPSYVTRAPAGKTLVGMLKADELDAGVVMKKEVDGITLRHVIGDPERAGREWRERTGARPMNHVMVVHERIARTQPWVGTEIQDLLAESKAAMTVQMPGGENLVNGVEAMRPSLELIIRYACQQGLIPRRFAVDELFIM